MTGISQPKRFLTSRWLLPISGEPIEHGAIELNGDRIKSLLTKEEFDLARAQLDSDAIADYGEAIISPGLINLHTHIEYSILHLLETNAALFDWIPMLMSHVKTWSPDTFIKSATLGARQMVRFGTTCIVDSSFAGYAAVGAARAGLRAIVGLEMFGIVESEADNIWKQWSDRKALLLERFRANEHEGFAKTADAIDKKVILLSVAPHAPYTVGPALTKKAMQWAEEQGIVWTMHVAESPQERRWIESTDERLDQFLQKVHTLPGGKLENIEWRGCGKSPVRYMADHDLLQESLVAAHVVQVDENDIDELARRQVTVAHCPRSNSRLRSGMSPISKMLEAGVRVGFGTDSSASTDDLDVLAEARFAWNLHRAINPAFVHTAREAIYRLTAGAAKSLGMSDSIGSLEPGKLADIAIFNISHCSDVARERPYDALLWGNNPVIDVFIGGEKVLQNDLYL
jgi:cytosine/adenosine deaminase-related metal-dependent hydrolase